MTADVGRIIVYHPCYAVDELVLCLEGKRLLELTSSSPFVTLNNSESTLRLHYNVYTDGEVQQARIEQAAYKRLIFPPIRCCLLRAELQKEL